MSLYGFATGDPVTYFDPFGLCPNPTADGSGCLAMIPKQSVIIQVSEDDLTWINNALNEVCNGLDLREFATRMGGEKSEVLKLLHRVSEALDGLP
jgi:hypothetical protein